MKINYTPADGKTIELEVSDDVGTFYLDSVNAEKKSDRRNSRSDRHSQLSTFGYEDARYFSDGTDLLTGLTDSEAVSHAMSHLTERQQYLIRKRSEDCGVDRDPFGQWLNGFVGGVSTP